VIEGGAGSTSVAQSASAFATHQHELPFGYAESGGVDIFYAADPIFGTGTSITMTGRNNLVEDTSSIATYLDEAVSAGTPSEANGGLPLRVSMAWWMRR